MVGDLIIRNSGSPANLSALVADGLINYADFDDVELPLASVTPVVALSELNVFNLVAEDDDGFDVVSLHALVTSGLVSLEQLTDGGVVTASHYADSVTGRTFERLNRSDIYDENLIEHHSLVSGDPGEEVVTLTAASGDTLFDAGGSPLALLANLARGNVVRPSHLAPGSQVDKDDILDNDLAELSELMEAGLIAVADVRPAARTIDFQDLDSSSTLPFSAVTGLDLLIDLGLLATGEVDGLGELAAADLVTAGLVSEDDLVDPGFFGTHLALPALLASGLVTIDELKTAALDDRSGLVSLAGLLDAGSLSVTLGNLQTENLVSENVRIDHLLDSDLVSILDLVEGGVNKTEFVDHMAWSRPH